MQLKSHWSKESKQSTMYSKFTKQAKSIFEFHQTSGHFLNLNISDKRISLITFHGKFHHTILLLFEIVCICLGRYTIADPTSWKGNSARNKRVSLSKFTLKRFCLYSFNRRLHNFRSGQILGSPWLFVLIVTLKGT